MKSKRIWAMMGVIYMILIFLLMLYWIARVELISGIPSLMLTPAAAALSAQSFNKAWLIRHGRVGHEEEADFVEPSEPQKGWEGALALGIVMAVVAVVLLVLGVGELMNFFTPKL